MRKTLWLRDLQPGIVCLGSHPGIIQSMLDYDYGLGHDEPSVKAIIAGGSKQQRYFWGEQEVVIPVYAQLNSLLPEIRQHVTCVLSVQSARRVLSGMREALELLPSLRVATVFAEQVPEAHALELMQLAKQSGVLVVGPASVGVLVPGVVKLGAIGGTMYPQLVAAGIFASGDTAVISTSGGMVNELIHTVTGSGARVSLALALGGDRYPVTSPVEAFLLAESDPQTQRIVYFGELGGDDEYGIASLIEAGQVTKPVICYIAGTVAELFAEPPQFGHAKAIARQQSETAGAKKAVLRQAGAQVLDVFADLAPVLEESGRPPAPAVAPRPIGPRRRRLIVSRISGDVAGEAQLLGRELLESVERSSLAGLIISLLLGREVTSRKLIAFIDFVLRLLADHGPYVSGAVNTIVTARAGRDLVSSLASGLLTIGPRFGGAVNAAAGGWLRGVQAGLPAKEFVAGHSGSGGIIAGIGHKKYRIDAPDPRVTALVKQFSGNANGDRYLAFAKSVEAVTTGKKGTLILNVDGAIAGMLLDLLESELGYSPDQLQELVDIEFFNAIFVYSRSAGLIAHYLDQRRHDEGLLRFGEDDITYLP